MRLYILHISVLQSFHFIPISPLEQYIQYVMLLVIGHQDSTQILDIGQHTSKFCLMRVTEFNLCIGNLSNDMGFTFTNLVTTLA